MLSLCMIVKNEEKNLERCLLGVKTLVDDIVIVDTGSIDNTKEIAKKFTDKVYDYAWKDDFSEARNFSISKASSDWVLILDADEAVNYLSEEDIFKFIDGSDKSVGRVQRVNLFSDSFGTKKYVERVNRLFNRKYFFYEGSIHEQVTSKNNEAYEMKNVELSLEHIGYTEDTIRSTNKLERNISMLLRELQRKQQDPYINYQLGKSYYMAKNYEMAEKYFLEAVKYMDDFKYEYAEDLVESLAYSFINNKKYAEAMIIEDFKNIYSKSPDYLFALAYVYMNNGQFQEAVEMFEKCTKFEEGKIDGITTFLPLYNIAVILECVGMKEDAIEYYGLCKDYIPAVSRLKEMRKLR